MWDGIELTSFVSPKWVPQLADAADVVEGVWESQPFPSAELIALVPNDRGMHAVESLLANRGLGGRGQHRGGGSLDTIALFTAASETFCRKNINCSIAESIERFRPVCEAARAANIRIRGAISCALGCPYQGEVAPQAVGYVARLMKEIGVEHVGVADTIGTGTPRATQRAMEAALAHYALDQVSGHFHDTYGQATANVYACLELGVSSFDTSIAGLGGCPYAKGATGNVATEDVLYLLRGLDIDTGIDFAQAVSIGQWISGVLGRKAFARAGNAVAARTAVAQAA